MQAQKNPKKPTCKPIKHDHPPTKPTQPTRPPEPINEQLADGLSVSLFSTDRQRICPIPEPPDPNPPLVVGEAAHLKGIPMVILIGVFILSLTRAYLSGTLNLLLQNYIRPDEIFEPASDEDGRESKDDKSGKCLMH